MGNDDVDLLHFAEPLLQFGFNQSNDDPKEGLFLFGPLTDQRKPHSMRIGVVGTPDGIFAHREWSARIRRYIPALRADSANHSAFPGFEAAFRTAWPEKPVIEIPVAANDVARSIRLSDRHLAIHETVSLFADPILRKLREEEIAVDLWFVVIPDDVYLYGRPLSKVPRSEQVAIQQSINQRFAKRLQTSPSLFEEDMRLAEKYLYGVDFHNQLKARLLLGKVTTQVVRESSLLQLVEPNATSRPRRLQDPATVAWNLCTAAFYKANGRPWRLKRIREKVCYIGLVFKKYDEHSESANACCGAQMFLDTGEGQVFRGAMGPWYSRSSKEFHLSRSAARSLIEETLETYRNQYGGAPDELFLHGKTYFNEEEWQGFKDAVPANTNLVGVRIRRSSEMKIFRSGKLPVLRGCAYKATDNKALLWTNGFTPALDTYPGREVPNPMSIEISNGRAGLEQVLTDVMGLTKLNYNACIYADGLPVTLRFADAIGEIITSMPPSQLVPPLPFRHYI